MVFKSKFRYHEIKEYVQKIADDYPDFVDMSVKGKTKEDRDIIVLKLGNSPDGNDTRAIWFDAGRNEKQSLIYLIFTDNFCNCNL